MNRDLSTDVAALFDAQDTDVSDVEEILDSTRRSARLAIGTETGASEALLAPRSDVDGPTSATVVLNEGFDTNPPTKPLVVRSAARGKRSTDFDDDFVDVVTVVDDSDSPAEHIARALADRRADMTVPLAPDESILGQPVPNWSDPADLDGPVDWDEIDTCATAADSVIEVAQISLPPDNVLTTLKIPRVDGTPRSNWKLRLAVAGAVVVAVLLVVALI